jgi:hypothetical protein
MSASNKPDEIGIPTVYQEDVYARMVREAYENHFADLRKDEARLERQILWVRFGMFITGLAAVAGLLIGLFGK